MRKILLLIILVLMPVLSKAAGWSSPLEISGLQVYGDSDTILVYTTGGSVLTEGCLVDKWVVQASNVEGKDRIYSTLLSSLMSGKKSIILVYRCLRNI